MKNILYNVVFFMGEAKKIIRLNLISNIFSILSTGLILFILGMVASGWWTTNRLVGMLQDEAEISVYPGESKDAGEVSQLIENIKGISGVQEVRLVGKSEAYDRMKEVLGEEANILKLFDENPFESFIEVGIDLKDMDNVVASIKKLEGVDYVRENRDVLLRIQSIAEGLKALGYLVMAAAGITTLVIVSHMIRQGISNYSDQINTLKLLGAPNSFIGFPFTLAGLLLTLGGGILAVILTIILINQVYGWINGPIPIISLPPRDRLISGIMALIMSVSIVLGILGSLFGLSSIREN